MATVQARTCSRVSSTMNDVLGPTMPNSLSRTRNTIDNAHNQRQIASANKAVTGVQALTHLPSFVMAVLLRSGNTASSDILC